MQGDILASRPSKIFISYRRSDSGHATRALAIGLRQAFGDRAVFVDTSSVEPGTTWPKEIRRALENADIVLAVVGRHWRDGGDEHTCSRLDSPKDWVRQEIARSIKRDAHIIPVLIDGARPPEAAVLPRALSKFSFKQAVELKDNSWENDVEGLIKSIASRGFTRRPSKLPTVRKKRLLPRLLLMDSYKKIYDRSRDSRGMNSHVIRELLRVERVGSIDIEPVSANWQADDEIERKQPDLIVIHYSCLDETSRPRNLERFLRLMLVASARTKVIVYSRTTGRPGDKAALSSFKRRIESVAGVHKNRVFGLPIYRYSNRAQKFTDPETKLALQRLVRDVLANRAGGLRSTGSRRQPSRFRR